MKFSVIDKTTGKSADLNAIVKEEWARWLFALWGFAVTDQGILLVVDTSGQYCICPNDRFTIVEKDK